MSNLRYAYLTESGLVADITVCVGEIGPVPQMEGFVTVGPIPDEATVGWTYIDYVWAPPA